MAQEIELPDGTILEFPDGMADTDINSAIKKNFPELFQPEKKEPGALDYLLGIGETGLSLASGAMVEPFSGLAGMAFSGAYGEQEGSKTVNRIQEALTYKPMTEGGQAVSRGLGEIVKPIAEPIEKTVQAASDMAYEYGGPVAGTAVKTAIAAIPELLALKGTRQAKKAALSHIVNKIDRSALYDELGQLLPQIKKSVADSGITMEEIKSFLPEQVGKKEMAATSEMVGDAAKNGLGSERKLGKLVAEVAPNEEILKAAEEFGVSDALLASHYSDNPTFRAIEQGLKSIPGSELGKSEYFLIEKLSTKADELIKEFGGSLEKSDLSDAFRDKSKEVIKGLEDSTDYAYKVVGDLIPKTTPANAKNTIGLIFNRAEELGGIKYLNQKEKRLLDGLSADTNPTYARLDKFRKEIGSAINSNTGPFRDSIETGQLKQLYKAIAEDQKAIAYQVGGETGKLYEMANNLVVTRKGIEKQLEAVIGKELTGAITDKARPAMISLQKGSTKQFDELLLKIPNEVGPEFKKQIVATALNDAFTQQGRVNRALNVSGFDDFMKGINRNPSAKKRLADTIGTDAIKRLDSFHTLIGGINRATKNQIRTGLITSLPGLSDTVEGLTSKLFGTGKKVANIATMGKAKMIFDMVSANKVRRVDAADALLSSGKFRQLIIDKAANRLNSGKKIARADEILNSLKEYQSWKKTLDKKTLSDLVAVGAMGYLTEKTTQEPIE